MRFVCPKPYRGCVGHQTSTIWYARLFAEMFGFQYVHSPLIDNKNFHVSHAAVWNNFFNFGYGEQTFESIKSSVGLITHSLGEYENVAKADMNWRYHALGRLADAVPDQYCLRFHDLCGIHPAAVLAWEQQGFVVPGTLQRVCAWFQSKLETCPRYQATPTRPYPKEMFQLAIYCRHFHQWELPYAYPIPPAEQLCRVVDAVRAAVAPRPLAVTVFTQTEGPPLNIVADHVDIAIAYEPSPAVAVAYKSLIEADLTLTTVGFSAMLVGIYRAFRKPTIGMPKWVIEAIKVPSSEAPYSIPVGFLQC